MTTGNDKKREADIARIVKERYPGRNLYFHTAKSHWYFGPSELSDVEAVDVSLQGIGGPPDVIGVKLYVDGKPVEPINDDILTPPTLRPLDEAVKTMRILHGLDEMPDWPRMIAKGTRLNNTLHPY